MRYLAALSSPAAESALRHRLSLGVFWLRPAYLSR